MSDMNKEYSMDELMSMSDEDFDKLAESAETTATDDNGGATCGSCSMDPCTCGSEDTVEEDTVEDLLEGESTDESYTEDGDDELGGADESMPTGKVFTQAEVDKIVKKRLAKEKNKAPADPLYTFAMEIVTESGMTPDEFIAQTRAARARAKAEYESKVASQHGLTPDTYRELQEARQLKAERAEEQRRRASIDEFKSEFPDVQISDIPDDVLKLFVEKGTPLVDAYSRHMVKQMKAKKPDTTINAPSSVASKGAAKKPLSMKDLEGKDQQFFMDNMDEIEKLYGDKKRRGY